MALAGVLLVATLGLLAVVIHQREPLVASVRGQGLGSAFGPLDPKAGYGELVRSLVHSAVMLTIALALISLVRRRPSRSPARW